MSGGSHAALMDGVYRRQRHIYDFTRKYYLFGRDSLIHELGLRPGESLVEVGCGTARNLIAIARRHPGVRLFGLDASEEMLKSARQAIARAGLEDRIRLIHGYAEDLAPALFSEAEPFDHAVFSYSLSMIPDWKQALESASRAVKPSGGMIHVVDFGDLTGLGRAGSSLLRAWLALFHVSPRAEIVQALEHDPSGRDRRKAAFRMLAGRYAFLFHGPADTVLQAVSTDVARGSQRGGNPGRNSHMEAVAMDIAVPHRPQ